MTGMKKRILSFVMAIAVLLSMLPASALSTLAAGGSDIGEMNALDAIGIDTTKAPDGFRATDTTSNPYGKGSVTVNPVSEVLLYDEYGVVSTAPDGSPITTDQRQTSLCGNEIYGATAAQDTGVMHYTADATAPTATLATASAAGSFLKAEGQAGLKKQFVRLCVDQTNGLQMWFGDAVSGQTGATALPLVEYGKIGNSGKDDFLTFSYQLQNYLQMATGDFDADGYDEVAVFVPETGKSTVRIYKLAHDSSSSDTSYQDPSNWKLAWTHAIYEEIALVPNMLSMTVCDADEDGTDDLALTYGYYYGTARGDYNTGRAVVMFGSSSAMLQRYTDFKLTDSKGNGIARAAFTYGQLTGVGTFSLVLGGQLTSDIEQGNVYTRYVSIYTYCGDNTFLLMTEKNFDLFQLDRSGAYVYSAMKINGNKRTHAIFYSSPLSVANLAVVNQGLSERPQLYFDSLILSYQESGLELTAAYDLNTSFQTDSNAAYSSSRFYTECKAKAADLIGNGYHSLMTKQEFLPASENVLKTLWLFGIIFRNIDTSVLNQIFPSGALTLPSEVWLNAFDSNKAATGYTNEAGAWVPPTKRALSHNRVNRTNSFCLPNTDKDTAYLKYTGVHYFRYTDPEVLAVLVSPPYFQDLANRDDLSGNYGESSTSFGESSGSSKGITAHASISAGVYVSFEQDIKVFGVTVASFEMEKAFTAQFTWDFERTTTREQSVEYSGAAGADTVVLFSIPVVVYKYDAYIPDANGMYTLQSMTVTAPHTACTKTMELDDYEAIAKDYKELPQIEGTVVTHTVGDPSTYPTSTAGYEMIAKYEGDYKGVGFSSTSGGSSISESITVSKETSNRFEGSLAFDFKVGAGAGGAKAGVTLGTEAGAGYITTSSSGCTYTGEVQNMPKEAEEFGYGLSWKLFAYQHRFSDGNSTKSFPVVGYLVTDVEMPPELPADFAQDVALTMANRNALTWTYDKMIAGFHLYRYYEFPDGSGSYELAYVPFKNGIPQPDGSWKFTYYDENLNPYTQYSYQIQSVRANAPNSSIHSEALVLRTKTDRGYPDISLNGLNEDGTVSIYPDSKNTVSVSVADEASLYPQGVSCQWQKLVGGKWTDLSGKTGDSYTFQASGYSDAGLYRCRINVVYYDTNRGEQYYISAYSHTFEAVYSMRGIKVETPITASVDEQGRPTVSLSLAPSNTALNAYPTGTVTFNIKSVSYAKAYTVGISATAGNTATWTLACGDSTALPEGVYEITASYSGSRVFQSFEQTTPYLLLVGAEGYRVVIYDKNGAETESVVYGDAYNWELIKYTPGAKTGDPAKTEKVTTARQTSFWCLGNGWHETPATWVAAPPARSVRIGVTQDEVEYFGYFTVTKRPITLLVAAKEQDDSYTSPVHVATNNLIPPTLVPAPGSTMAYGQNFRSFINLYASDTAGRAVTMAQNMDPGAYCVTGQINASAELPGYGESIPYANCYEVSFVPRMYYVTGEAYDVAVRIAQVNGKDAGTVTMISPLEQDGYTGSKISSGIALSFEAKPYAGYDIKSWTVVENPGTAREHSLPPTYSTVLNYTMQDAPITIYVAFMVEKRSVTVFDNEQYSDGREIGGSVLYPRGFANGATVAEGAVLEFEAQAKAGYTFDHWEIYTSSSTAEKVSAAKLLFTMPVGSNANVRIYPIFVRDKYTLTLAPHLRAAYTVPTEKGDVTVYAVSGDRITGDTELTVQSVIGYTIPADAQWLIDGQQCVIPNPAYPGDGTVPATIPYTGNTYRFKLLRDTAVATDVAREKFSVTVSADVPSDAGNAGNCVTAAWNAETKTVYASETIANVEGGTAFTFTAAPAYGYLLDHWVLNGAAVSEKGLTLTVNELGGNLEVKAVFVHNTAYSVLISFQAEQGSGSYQVFDRANTEQASGALTGNADRIPVFQGDTIVVTMIPEATRMVDKWSVNGEIVANPHATQKTFSNLSGDMNIRVDFKSKSYYTVSYGVTGDGGSIVSATTDGVPFISGYENVGGGSKIVITAKPDDGKTVDQWTVNGVTCLTELNTPNVSKTLVIDGLSESTVAVDIRVSFKDIVTHTVTIDATNATFATNLAELEVYPAGTQNYVEGQPIILTAHAAAGYILKGISCVGDTPDEMKNNADGSITCRIHMLDQDVAVAAITAPAYSIIVPVAINGTVTVDKQQAAEGDRVTVTALPASGYYTAAVEATWLDGAETKSLPVTNGCFTMPAGEVTVTAAFAVYSSAGGIVVAPTPQIDTRDGAVTEQQVKNALKAAGEGNGITVNLTGAGQMTASIPREAMQAIVANGGTLTVSTLSGSIVLSEKALVALAGSDVCVTVEKTDRDAAGKSLTCVFQSGDAIFRVAVTAGNHPVHDFGGALSLTFQTEAGNTVTAPRVVHFLANGSREYYVPSVSANALTVSGVRNLSWFAVVNADRLTDLWLDPFGDVKESDWFYSAVAYANINGLFTGTSRTAFGPNEHATRGMLWTVLARLDGVNTSGGTTWFERGRSWAMEKGISDGSDPNQVITRAQLVTMLYRYAQYKGADVSGTISLAAFTDATRIPEYATAAMQWAVHSGIIKGSGTALTPNNTATRAQVAAVFARFAQLQK